MDVDKIRFDGQVQSINGLRFRYSQNLNCFSFYIQSIGVKNRRIRIDMQPDVNHNRPHIHGKNHQFSFALDDLSFIHGESKCSKRETKAIREWASKHQQDLLQLWDIVKQGLPRDSEIENIRKKR